MRRKAKATEAAKEEAASHESSVRKSPSQEPASAGGEAVGMLSGPLSEVHRGSQEDSGDSNQGRLIVALQPPVPWRPAHPLWDVMRQW
jgi:hypothetical protein